MQNGQLKTIQYFRMKNSYEKGKKTKLSYSPNTVAGKLKRERGSITKFFSFQADSLNNLACDENKSQLNSCSLEQSPFYIHKVSTIQLP